MQKSFTKLKDSDWGGGGGSNLIFFLEIKYIMTIYRESLLSFNFYLIGSEFSFIIEDKQIKEVINDVSDISEENDIEVL